MGITRNDFVTYVEGLVGQSIDTDGVFNAQCVDLITHVQKKFWNFWGQGNAVDFASNKMPNNWQRGTVAQIGVKSGDVLVWQWSPDDEFGHIGICVAFGNGIAKSVEQNVDGTFGGPARYRERGLEHCIAVLRPNFDDEANAPKQAVHKEYTEYGTMTVTVDAINVRRAPNTDEPPVATYTKGMTIHYDYVIIDVDGFVWISYIGGSGKRNYVATGVTRNGTRYGQAWGTFK